MHGGPCDGDTDDDFIPVPWEVHTQIHLFQGSMARVSPNAALLKAHCSCTPVCRATLFAIAKRREQPKCPLTGTWINNVCYRHTVECYRGLKREGILTPAKTGCGVKGIMQSDMSRSRPDPCRTSPSTVQFTEAESRMLLTGRRERGAGVSGDGAAALRGEESWGAVGGGCPSAVWALSPLWSCTVKNGDKVNFVLCVLHHN